MRHPTSQCSGGEGESEAGHLPALTSSLLGTQESSSESKEAALVKTASVACDVPPTGNQDAVVIHVTEDKLKNLD